MEELAARRGLTRKTIDKLLNQGFDSVESLKQFEIQKHLANLDLGSDQSNILMDWTREIQGDTTNRQLCYKYLQIRNDLLKAVESNIKSEGLKNFPLLIEPMLSELSSTHVHICVSGDAEVGKTSLIARFLEFPSSPRMMIQGAQKQGAVPFCHMQSKHVVLWDYNKAWESERYVGRKDQPQLDMFDVLVVCSARRFLEIDEKLAKVAAANQMPLYYVRTKIDHDVRNEERDRGDPFDESAFLERIKAGSKKYLLEAGVQNPRLYAVSTSYQRRNDWDLLKLYGDLMEDTPRKNLPGFLLKVKDLCQTFINQKHQELIGQVPNLTNDIIQSSNKNSLLDQKKSYCTSQFGLEFGHNATDAYDDRASDDLTTSPFREVQPSQLSRCKGGCERGCECGDGLEFSWACFLLSFCLCGFGYLIWLLIQHVQTQNQREEAEKFNRGICSNALKSHIDTLKQDAFDRLNSDIITLQKRI